MSSAYNQPQVSHPSLAHRAAGDTGENGHHLEVHRWVKLVKGVILHKPVFPWKSTEITMPWAPLFGVELRDLSFGFG